MDNEIYVSDAVKRLSEILISPEQLEKVDSLRHTIEEKQRSIEAQLLTSIQVQLEQVRQGKQQLSQCSESFAQLHQSFHTVGERCKQSRDQLPQYSLLKQLTIVRENLHKTIVKCKNLAEIEKKITGIREMIKDDRNIYVVHKDLHELRELRREALLQSKDMTERHEGLLKQFHELDALIVIFEKSLFNLVEQAIDMSVHRPATLVKAFIVVEKEEKFDKSRTIDNKSLQYNTDKTQKTVGFQPLLQYRKRALEAIQTWILQHFDYAFAALEKDLHITVESDDESLGLSLETSIEDVTERYLKEANQMLGDLQKVQKHLTKCTPKSLKIFDFFVKEYHKHFYSIFLRFANQARILSAKDTLALVGWVKNDYENFLLKIGYSLIEPSLIEPLEELMKGFRVHCQKLMDGWISRNLEEDQKTAPEEVNGLFYTAAPVTVFRIVSKQVDVVITMGYNELTYQVVMECLQSVATFQNMLFTMFREKWEDLYFEYIIALINNNKIASGCVSEFEAKVKKLLDSSYFSQLNFDTARQTFLKVAESGVTVLARAICRDLQEVMALVGSKEWVETEDPYMDAVCDTIVDYMVNDVEKALDKEYHKSVLVACVDCVLNSYIRALTRKNNQPINARFNERLALEQQIITDFADAYIKDDISKEKIAKLTILRVLFTKLDAPSFLDAISKLYHGYQIKFLDYNALKIVLKRRPDVDKNLRKMISHECRDKIYSQPPPQQHVAI